MPFFNLRRGGSSSSSTAGLAAPAESLEVVRKRAKHRLIGSAVLVLLGVIGFPLLFDTQPRPVAVNIPIEIPSKQGARSPSLSPASQAPLESAVAEAATAGSATTADAAKVAPPEAPVAAPVQASKPAALPAPLAAQAPPPVLATPAIAPAAKADEGARAKSLLEGKASSEALSANSTDSERLVVQVGAFADAGKAREARLKLERAGLKTYTQVAETKDGKRIRVRVGPFDKKADAYKAAKQIKALDLPAAILTL